MFILEKYREYTQKYGTKYTLALLFKFRVLLPINQAFLIVGKIFFSKARLRNTILIESHNDFDCNGGAIYDYLIANHYNEKYNLIWLVKNKVTKKMPKNVQCFNYYKPSIKKTWFIATAKFLFSDDLITKKMKNDQVSVYCTHGGCAIKNVKGILVVPNDVDYILSSSNNFDPIMCDNYSIPYPNTRMLHFGFPSNDVFFNTSEDELKKVTKKNYAHVFLWMPTFRKIKDNINRIDGVAENPLGIPIFSSMDELKILNEKLVSLNCLLIIKIHPMQDPLTITDLKDESNIIILDAKRVKELGIDNYRLMKSAHAFISDYSSATYSYLLLNRPIGFVTGDLASYKRGLAVSNYKDFMPGEIINSVTEFNLFIKNVCYGIDNYRMKREKITEWLYENREGHSTEKLLVFLNIVNNK